jgi:putative phosphoesterase
VNHRIIHDNISNVKRPGTEHIVGVISDTHGLLRPEVIPLFKGVDLILHAGDIGRAEVLDELRAIAPVVAVRGNNDDGKWAERIRESETAEIGGVLIYMLHDLKTMDGEGPAGSVQVVVSGHSHRPAVERRGTVLFLNPGSAGPRRFKLPISVARLIIQGASANAELIEI